MGVKKIFIDIVAGRPHMPAVLMNMDAYAQAMPLPDNGKSQFLDADFTHAWLKDFHKQHRVPTSAGGYFENRYRLWEGSYLTNPPNKPKLSKSEAEASHFAIDINLPAGTPLTVRHPSIVEKIEYDNVLGADGGWGTVVVFRLVKPIGPITHYLYGHMEKRMRVRPGMLVMPGQIVGRLGKPQDNGGWFEHTHVHAFSLEGWARSGHANIKNVKRFDGYGLDNAQRRCMYPDSTPLIGRVPLI